MDDYKDTAYRMYEDAEILLNNNKWFNTCYLSGYVLECYCKLVLHNAMLQGDITQKPLKSYSHKVSRMESDISTVQILGNQLAKYCLDLSCDCSNMLAEWDPINRYKSNNGDWDNENKARQYKAECEILMEQILSMELDGVI